MKSRRSILRAVPFLTAAVLPARSGSATAEQSVPLAGTDKSQLKPSTEFVKVEARAKEAFLVPGDFLAPSDGSGDAQPALQQAFDSAARLRRPLVINGVYRLLRPLAVRSNINVSGTGSLRANHSGSLLRSGEQPVGRVHLDGLRLEAEAAQVAKALDGNQWQYARLTNLRLMSAGGVFREGICFENVAYWNSVSSLEGEAVQTLFVLGDANNFVMNDINWCRFSDIGMKSFIRLSAACGAVYGRKLSIEGVFRKTTLVRLLPECSGIDLEFLRVECRKGSADTTFFDFNGSRGNWLKVPPALYGIDSGALIDEGGNFITFLNGAGQGVFHMGRGQAVAPLAEADPTLPGGFNYNSVVKRLRAFVNGARSVAFTPAVEPLDMAGNDIMRASGLWLQRDLQPRNGDGNEGGARLYLDPQDGGLRIMFGDGSIERIVDHRPNPGR